MIMRHPISDATAGIICVCGCLACSLSQHWFRHVRGLGQQQATRSSALCNQHVVTELPGGRLFWQCSAYWYNPFAFLFSCPAGDVVSFSLAASNIGNLKLSNVTLVVPALVSLSMTCNVGAADFNNGSSVLAPGALLICTASYHVTTADIEAAAKTLTVSVTATSVLGGSISSEKEVTLTPQPSPKLTVNINAAGCSSAPTTIGKYVRQRLSQHWCPIVL